MRFPANGRVSARERICPGIERRRIKQCLAHARGLEYQEWSRAELHTVVTLL